MHDPVGRPLVGLVDLHSVYGRTGVVVQVEPERFSFQQGLGSQVVLQNAAEDFAVGNDVISEMSRRHIVRIDAQLAYAYLVYVAVRNIRNDARKKERGKFTYDA